MPLANGKPKIGVVAIQGDYDAHAKSLARIGVEASFIRVPADLAGLSGVTVDYKLTTSVMYIW